MQTIIISRTDNIGDVVLTLPMAGVLRERYPEARIYFLGKRYTEAIIGCSKFVDEFLNWEEIEKLAFKEQVALFKMLNADAIVHVYPNKKVAEVAKAAGIGVRIGTLHRPFHWFTCNRFVNLGRKNSDLHEAQLNFKLLNPLGITKLYSKEEIEGFYGFENIKPLRDDLKALISENQFNLILHPKSNNSAREWGIDNFSKLMELLPATEYKVFITGTAAEGLMVQGFLNHYQNRVVDLTGQLTLDELVSFINAVDGLVAASTGVLHIAAAAGKRVVGIFAPMRPIFPRRWAPIGKDAHVLVADKKCSDCKKLDKCECIEGIEAMGVMKLLKH